MARSLVEALPFCPNDPVLYKQGANWIPATVLRVSFPFHREVTLADGVEFTAIPEPQAVVRLADGSEVSAPFAKLRHL